VNYNYISENTQDAGNAICFTVDVGNMDTYFKITALTINGESEQSEPVFASKKSIPTFSITAPTANQLGVSVTPTIRWNPSDVPTTAAYIIVLQVYDPATLDYTARMAKKCSGSVTSWTVDSSDNILVTYFDGLSGTRLDYSTKYNLIIWAIDASGMKLAEGIGTKFTTMPAP
jgi:hypothetical protein